MALPETDNFDRENANPIGGNWTTSPGANAMQIASNVCTGTAAGAINSAYWNADAFDTNQYSECKCSSTGGIGPAIRIQTGAEQFNCYYIRRQSSSAIRGMKAVNGTLTQVGSDISSTTGTGDVIRLGASGSTLSYSLNGSAVGDFGSDATHSGGAAGVFIGTTVISVNDWGGGNVGGGATPITANITDAKDVQADSLKGFRTMAAKLSDNLNA